MNQTNGNLSASSPNKKAQIFVSITKYNDSQMVYDKILNSYFRKNFINLNEIDSESEEANGILRELVTYEGIAKNDNKPIYLLIQFASEADNTNSNIILYTGIIRKSEGEEVLESVKQALRNIELKNNGSSAPVAIAKPTPTSTPTSKPTPTSTLPQPTTSTNSSLNCPGSKLTEAEIQIILKQHNDERAKVGVPPLVWNCTLANYAQKWADRGIFEHSSDDLLQKILPGIAVGENLAADSEANGVPGVQGWIDEKPFWNNQTATCKAGEVCGHYTQMVWRTTTQIGCGINRKTPGEFVQFFVCNYSPAGNYDGPAY